jgi:hypothetical protein
MGSRRIETPRWTARSRPVGVNAVVADFKAGHRLLRAK